MGKLHIIIITLSIVITPIIQGHIDLISCDNQKITINKNLVQHSPVLKSLIDFKNIGFSAQQKNEDAIITSNLCKSFSTQSIDRIKSLLKKIEQKKTANFTDQAKKLEFDQFLETFKLADFLNIPAIYNKFLGALPKHLYTDHTIFNMLESPLFNINHFEAKDIWKKILHNLPPFPTILTKEKIDGAINYSEKQIISWTGKIITLHKHNKDSNTWTGSQLIAHKNNIKSILKRENGQFISWDNEEIILWSQDEQTKLWTHEKFDGHTNEILNVLELSDGQIISCGLNETFIRRYNLEEKKWEKQQLKPFKVLRKPIELPNKKIILQQNSDEIAFFRYDNQSKTWIEENKQEHHQSDVIASLKNNQCITFSKAENNIYIWNYDSQKAKWNYQTLTFTNSIQHTFELGNKIIVLTNNGHIHILIKKENTWKIHKSSKKDVLMWGALNYHTTALIYNKLSNDAYILYHNAYEKKWKAQKISSTVHDALMLSDEEIIIAQIDNNIKQWRYNKTAKRWIGKTLTNYSGEYALAQRLIKKLSNENFISQKNNITYAWMRPYINNQDSIDETMLAITLEKALKKSETFNLMANSWAHKAWKNFPDFWHNRYKDIVDIQEPYCPIL